MGVYKSAVSNASGMQQHLGTRTTSPVAKLQVSTVLSMLIFEQILAMEKKTCGADVLLRDLSFCWLTNFDTGSAMPLRLLATRKLAVSWELIS